MDDSDRGGGCSFRIDFSREGEKRLKEEVKAKLEEFIGYKDDVLADYVIVLVKNGKHKEVAEQDLHVFLGDDSSSFVSWLWGNLSSNLHLYVEPRVSTFQDEVHQSESLVSAHENEGLPVEPEHVEEMVVKEAGGRRKRQWRGPTRDELEPPPLRTSELDNYLPKNSSAHSSRSNVQKEHYHHKEQILKEQNQQIERKSKKNVKSEVKVDAPRQLFQSDAPRRLLQSAFREALGPLRSIDNSRSEPVLKRLRSVVASTIHESSVTGVSQGNVNRLVSKNFMSTAMKAAAESAHDTSRARPNRNVINRLDHDAFVEGTDYVGNREMPQPKEPCSDYDRDFPWDLDPPVHRRDKPGQLISNECKKEIKGSLPNLDRNMEAGSGFASDNDVGQSLTEVDQNSYARNKHDNSLTMEYSVTPQSDEVPRRRRLKEQSAAVIGKPTHKIVNISVNVNTLPPHFHSASDVPNVEEQIGLQDRGRFSCRPRTQLVQEKEHTVENTNEKTHVDAHKKEDIVLSAPGSHSTIRSSDDVESRSIYVSNVHFGATKDLLSTHFNKCGEVQKVVIVMDAATGQPTGSAYVEFVCKESAELALSLNGTYFMSRILKVVPRSSVPQEAAQMIPWSSGFHRPSLYSSRPIPSLQFARGVPSMYARPPPLKVGPHSLQWKRDSPSSLNTANSGFSAGTPPAATPLVATPRRSLTYIRTPK